MSTITKNLEKKNLTWNRGRDLAIGQGWRTMLRPLDPTVDPHYGNNKADKVEFDLFLKIEITHFWSQETQHKIANTGATTEQ